MMGKWLKTKTTGASAGLLCKYLSTRRYCIGFYIVYIEVQFNRCIENPLDRNYRDRMITFSVLSSPTRHRRHLDACQPPDDVFQYNICRDPVHHSDESFSDNNRQCNIMEEFKEHLRTRTNEHIDYIQNNMTSFVSQQPLYIYFSWKYSNNYWTECILICTML